MQNQNGDIYYGGAVTMPAIPKTAAPAVQSAPAILVETAAVTETSKEIPPTDTQPAELLLSGKDC